MQEPEFSLTPTLPADKPREDPRKQRQRSGRKSPNLGGSTGGDVGLSHPTPLGAPSRASSRDLLKRGDRCWYESPENIGQIIAVDGQFATVEFSSGRAIEGINLSRLHPPAPWNPDNWETPDWLAAKMASLILPTDRFILEPAAGTGQICRQIELETKSFRFQRLAACELNSERRIKGEANSPLFSWHQFDFVSQNPDIFYFCPHWYENLSVVITNPPFSLAVDFIEQGLKVLDPAYEHARLLFLLPGDFFQAKGRGERFKSLNCHIHHRYSIVGRVAYLRDGKEFKGRQICDAVFDIRPGKKPGFDSFWMVP